jgi:hypothetical protein
MKNQTLILVLIILAALLLTAGCMQTSAPPVTTQTTIPTTVTTPLPAGTTAAITTKVPEPVRTLPDNYAVAVDVASNGLSINPKIIMTYRGGKGTNFVYQVEAQVTRGDGMVESGSLRQPLRVGDAIELGASGGNTDSVQVWITLQNGEKYKVYDEIVPFRQFH